MMQFGPMREMGKLLLICGLVLAAVGLLLTLGPKLPFRIGRLPGTSQPRLLFFIDEIGGGGGRQALFPSFPYESAAKWGLNYLVRQGRAVGICCVFATQNPGDVDYKALSNCQTWIIGKLATDRDRKKVLEVMEVWGGQAERVKRNLTAAPAGDFVAKTIRGEIRNFRERWLMSYHRVLTLTEVGKLLKGGQHRTGK